MNILKGAIALAAIIMTAGCSSTSAPSNTPAETKSTTTAMVMKSSAAANTASVGYIPASSVTAIADNFNTADGLVPAWGSGRLPDSMGTDPMGAFRMICSAGQISYDDPLVYPGQPGMSHLHQFYGNVSADANSTYASLRENGGSTCGDPTLSYAVNRSGYWMPAMLDGAGNVVKPMYVAIYYKRAPASSKYCDPSSENFIGICVGLPTGLRFITGYNFQGGANDAAALFYCQDNNGIKPLDENLRASNMAAVVSNCPVGTRLTLNIDGPDCWDGVNLDSPDHRSHVSHSVYYTDSNGVSVEKCDAAHPYYMPKISIIALYVTDANFAAGKWHLSSDEMVPGAPAGTTFHADYLEGWSPTVRDGWLKNCIDAHMSCQGGDLGDGTQIKGMTVPTAGSVLVALSSIPHPTSSSTAVASTTDTSTSATPVVSSPVVVSGSDTSTDTTTTTTATATSSGTADTSTTATSGTTSTTTATSSGTTAGTTTTSGSTSGTTTAAKGGGTSCKGKAKKCSTS